MNLLKEIRNVVGMTQEDVADKLGVTVNTVQNWERFSRFGSPEKLNELLDLYGVNGDLRKDIIFSVYGRNGSKENLRQINYDMLMSAVDVLNSEKDVNYYTFFPVDAIITALTVLENRIECLSVTISYLEMKFLRDKELSLLGTLDTAYIIDSVGKEYGVEVGAVSYFQVQKINEKVNAIFCFGEDDGHLYFQEFGKYMNYREYFDALKKKIVFPLVLEKLEVENLLKKIEDERCKLSCLRESVLFAVCNLLGIDDMIDISGLVDVNNHIFWEVVTIKAIGKSFLKNSTLERMKEFLFLDKNVSIDRRIIEKMDLYCNSSFCDKVTAEKAMDILINKARCGCFDHNIMMREEWIYICKRSKVLADYINCERR